MMVDHEGFETPEDSGAPRDRSCRTRYPVVLTRVDAIGLRLAVALLTAGYAVFGQDIAPGFRAGFEAAGGRVLDESGIDGDAVWSIDCREQTGLRPETLSMLLSGKPGYGRPRLELNGSQQAPARAGGQAVATLTIRAPEASQSELQVLVGVSPRGPELVVNGGHTLFEKALPLLTTFADRVLYAGVSREPSS